MTYAWFSISDGCLNYANRLIEQETEKILKIKGIRKSYSVFKYLSDKDIAYINSNCSFVIIPGCTTLHDSTKGLDLAPQEIIKDQRRGYKATARLKDITIPIYNISGAFGSNEPTLKVAKYIEQPIGVRDPFTHAILKKNNIKSIFIGCPTLFVGQVKNWQYHNGPIIFNFGAGSIELQIELLNKINKIYDNVIIVLQEKNQKNIIKQYKISNRCIEYGNPNSILSLYNKAFCVITGRLHAALPSLALGTPVIFIKTHDSQRFTLLEYLGLPMLMPDDNKKIFKLLNDIKQERYQFNGIFKKIFFLKKQYSQYIKLINKKISKFK